MYVMFLAQKNKLKLKTNVAYALPVKEACFLSQLGKELLRSSDEMKEPIKKTVTTMS